MKVIGGQARGRALYAPRGSSIRITADRVKESLFDILQPLGEPSFLDLFAGTGNVGIEALSRGAREVVFVEKRRLHVETIRKNLSRCGFDSRFEVVAVAVERGVSMLGEGNRAVDIIFADPPYERGLVKKTLSILRNVPILERDGMLIIEHSVREACTGDEDYVLFDCRRYGDTSLSFFKFTNKE